MPTERRRQLLDDVPRGLKRPAERMTEARAEEASKKITAPFCVMVASSVVHGTLQNEWVSRSKYEVELLRQLTGLPVYTAARIHRAPRKRFQRPGKMLGRARLSILMGRDPANSKHVHRQRDQRGGTAKPEETLNLWMERDDDLLQDGSAATDGGGICAASPRAIRSADAQGRDGTIQGAMCRGSSWQLAGRSPTAEAQAERERVGPSILRWEGDSGVLQVRCEGMGWINNAVIRRVPKDEAVKVPRSCIFKAPLRMVRTNEQSNPVLPLIAKSRLVVPGHLDPQLGDFRTDSRARTWPFASKPWQLPESTSDLPEKVYLQRRHGIQLKPGSLSRSWSPLTGWRSHQGSGIWKRWTTWRPRHSENWTFAKVSLWQRQAKRPQLGHFGPTCGRRSTSWRWAWCSSALQDQGVEVAWRKAIAVSGRRCDPRWGGYPRRHDPVHNADQGGTLERRWAVEWERNHSISATRHEVEMACSTDDASDVVRGKQLAQRVNADYKEAVKLHGKFLEEALAGRARLTYPKLDLKKKLFYLSYFHASVGKEQDGKSQLGVMHFITTEEARQRPTLAAAIEYSTSKSTRVVRSSMAAESASMSMCIDRHLYGRIVLDMMLWGYRDLDEQWRTMQVAGGVVTDARSLYDHLGATGQIPAERQTMLDLMVARHYLEAGAYELFWVPTHKQFGDGLTKKMRNILWEQFRKNPKLSLKETAEERKLEDHRAKLRKGQRLRRKEKLKGRAPKAKVAAPRN